MSFLSKKIKVSKRILGRISEKTRNVSGKGAKIKN
jgi:hypothetical protein